MKGKKCKSKSKMKNAKNQYGFKGKPPSHKPMKRTAGRGR